MTTPTEDLFPWLPVADVVAWIGASAGANAAEIEWARAAAADYVEDNRRDLFDEDGVFRPTPRVVMAAKLAAARCYARKGSPVGISPASYSEFGAAILAYDPDVERFLGVGRYATPYAG